MYEIGFPLYEIGSHVWNRFPFVWNRFSLYEIGFLVWDDLLRLKEHFWDTERNKYRIDLIFVSTLFLLDTEWSLAGGWLDVCRRECSQCSAGAVWRPMMNGRHLLPDIDIWPAHVTPPPSLWYYIIYRLAQPFKVHPHTKIKSQSSSADRNDRRAPAPDQCKAVPSQAAAQGHVWW